MCEKGAPNIIPPPGILVGGEGDVEGGVDGVSGRCAIACGGGGGGGQRAEASFSGGGGGACHFR